MTDAQKRFCDEYLIDLNATRAYKVAYPKIKKDHTATVNGNRLLTFADIKKYISDKIKEREKRTEVTQDRVIQELAKIAFVDIRELYNDSGGLKNIKEIDRRFLLIFSVAGYSTGDSLLPLYGSPRLQSHHTNGIILSPYPDISSHKIYP